MVTRLRYSRAWEVPALVNCCNNLCSPFICSEDAILPCPISCARNAFQGPPHYWMGPHVRHFHPARELEKVCLWTGKRASPAPAEETALSLKMCSNRHCPKHRLGQSSASTSLGGLMGKAWCLQEKHEKISCRAEGRRSPRTTRNSAAPPFGKQGVYLCSVPAWVAMGQRALCPSKLQLSCKFLQCHDPGRDRCRGKAEGGHRGTPPTASHTACALALTRMENYISVTGTKCFSSAAFGAA